MVPQRLLYLARGEHRVRTPHVALQGLLPSVLQLEPQHSCLLLLKGGGVPSWRKAGLKGPHPRGSQMTGQGHTEASSQGRGAGQSSPAG